MESLAEGLIGRSENPVSLLFDQLLLPNADLGCQSPPVITWRHHKDLAIDHVVLGRGCVGGSWTNMPADLQSLSYAQWLQLPDMPVVDFLDHIALTETGSRDRGICGIIAQYYQHYVRQKSLQSKFVCSAEVTHVRKLYCINSDDEASLMTSNILQPCHCCVSPLPPCCESQVDEQELQLSEPCPLSSAYLSSSGHCSCASTTSSNTSIASSPCSSDSEFDIFSSVNSPPSVASASSLSMNDQLTEEVPSEATTTESLQYDRDFPWVIRGCRARRPFTIQAKQVVLAVGASDEPRRLNVPGESLDMLSYGCPTPSKLNDLTPSVSAKRPLIVVGCGLTAADTILLALQHDLPVVHVFGREVSDTSLVVNRMPESVYPEYARIGKLMRRRVANSEEPLMFDNEEPYISLPRHHIISVTPDSCILQDSSGREVSLMCSHIFVAAGSRPNLSFLPQSGQNLAFEPGSDFDCRVNPVDIDPLTFESRRVADLYAMGPLVGDNFVRFAIGASLGITKSLAGKHHLNESHPSST